MYFLQQLLENLSDNYKRSYIQALQRRVTGTFETLSQFGGSAANTSALIGAAAQRHIKLTGEANDKKMQLESCLIEFAAKPSE